MDPVVVLDAPGDETAADGDATAIWVSAEAVNCPEGSQPPCFAYEVQAAGYDPDGIPEVTVEAPAEGTTGEPVEVLTPTENLYSPVIEFGDGESVAGTAATHTYADPGEYEVVAAGAEELGYRGTAARTITIRDSGKVPGTEGSGGEEPGGGSGDGEEQPSPPAAASPAPPTSSSSGCETARAAKKAAVQHLRQARRTMKRAPSPRRRRTLAARVATFRQASAGVASAC